MSNPFRVLLPLAITVALAVFTLTAGVATAGTVSKVKLDADGDERISRTEAANHPRIAKGFDRIDANHDGYLSRDELKVAKHKRAAARFKQIDQNGDGRISRSEAEKTAPRLAKRFDQIDTNRDGFLSKEELKTVRAARKSQN